MMQSSANYAELLRIARTLAADRSTAEVVVAFRKAGIRSVLLKGPALQSWLYGCEPRTYRDSDLLVPPDRIEETEQLLVTLGFVHHPFDDIPHDRPWHAHSWFRRKDGSNVDLHRTLIGVGVDPETLWLVLANHTEIMKVAGIEVEILSPPARAMHVALHAAQDGAKPTKSLRDLRRALDRVPADVWEDAARLARECRAVPAFIAGLRLVAKGGGVIERLGLTASETVEVVLRTEARGNALAIDWMSRTPGLAPKLRFALRKFFPPVAFIRVWSPIRNHGPGGLAASYVYRFIWMLAHSPSAAIDWNRARRRASRLSKSQESREGMPGI
jgi:Uncharacterised nucleotidyltransferase